MYNPLFSVQQIVTEKMNAIFLFVNEHRLSDVHRQAVHETYNNSDGLITILLYQLWFGGALLWIRLFQTNL